MRKKQCTGGKIEDRIGKENKGTVEKGWNGVSGSESWGSVLRLVRAERVREGHLDHEREWAGGEEEAGQWGATRKIGAG